MTATIQQRAEAARKETASLTAKIEQAQKGKRDGGTLSSAAKNSQTPLAPVRTPPSQVKCRRTLKGHFGKIMGVDWSADGKTLVTASQDGNLLLWDALSANKKQNVRLKSSYVMSVAIEQKTAQFVAAGGLDNVCTVYQVGGEGGARLKKELVSHEGYLSDCKFFHSPSKMLTSSGDSTSLLWDVEKGTILTTFAEHKNSVVSAELVGSSSFLSCSVDKTIKMWDVRTDAEKVGSVQTFTGHGSDVNGITLLKPTNGASFATCSEDGTVRVWDARAYGEVARFGQLTEQSERDPFSDGDNGFTSITSSSSGRLVFCGHSEGSVVCYDVLSSHNPVQSTYVIKDAHEEHISCVRVSPTGEVICTGSWDCNVKLFA